MKALHLALLLAVTVAAYGLSRIAAKRRPSPLTTPVFFSTPIILLALKLTGMRADDYRPTKDLIVLLLGPATVALAVPLYRNRHTLVRNVLPALVGLAAGSVTTLVAALLLAKAFALSRVICASISIKSVTAPIAIELAPLVHGDSTLATAFVVLTGLIGAMLGPPLLDAARIRAPLARGLALGAISHGQGTAQAVAEGELQGAAAGIAMGLAAVVTSLVAPVLVPLLA
jgi:putative effector of murein hydrolase